MLLWSINKLDHHPVVMPRQLPLVFSQVLVGNALGGHMRCPQSQLAQQAVCLYNSCKSVLSCLW